MPLGQSALYAYAAHVGLALPIAYVLDNLEVADRWSRPLNGAIQLTTLLVIWGLIKGRILFVSPVRGTLRYLLPIAAMLTAIVLIGADPSPTLPGVASAAPPTDPYASRVARAFGTPIPGRPPPADGTPVPLPTPRPSLRQLQLPAIGVEARASRYVGDLAGSLQNIQFYSPALGRDMPYFVYLPPDYQRDLRRYPVLYMLHGNSGSYEEWPGYGLVGAADRMIAARDILPMIIVMPQGDFSYWVNHADGGPSTATTPVPIWCSISTRTTVPCPIPHTAPSVGSPWAPPGRSTMRSSTRRSSA